MLDKTAETGVALTSPDKAIKQLTRRNHSHPAAYVLKQDVTDKLYVGSTENLHKRINAHRNYLQNGIHRNRNLQEAFDEDSRFSLSFTETKTKEEALVIEQKMLDNLIPTGKLLNIATNVYKAGLDVTRSEETKQKLRELTTKQFSSTESREKHSEISKKLWQDPVFREKNLQTCKDSFTRERLQQVSETSKEKWKDPNFREKFQESSSWRWAPILVNEKEYPSILEASRQLGLSVDSLRYRLKNNLPKYDNFSYIPKEENKS